MSVLFIRDCFFIVGPEADGTGVRAAEGDCGDSADVPARGRESHNPLDQW